MSLCIFTLNAAHADDRPPGGDLGFYDLLGSVFGLVELIEQDLIRRAGVIRFCYRLGRLFQLLVFCLQFLDFVFVAGGDLCNKGLQIPVFRFLGFVGSLVVESICRNRRPGICRFSRLVGVYFSGVHRFGVRHYLFLKVRNGGGVLIVGLFFFRSCHDL